MVGFVFTNADMFTGQASTGDPYKVLLIIILCLLTVLIALCAVILALQLRRGKGGQASKQEARPAPSGRPRSFEERNTTSGIVRCPNCGSLHHYSQTCACMRRAPAQYAQQFNTTSQYGAGQYGAPQYQRGGNNMQATGFHSIEITCGTMKGFSVPIAPGETIYIGRDPHCGLVIGEDYIAVSRRHCSVTLRPAGDRFEVMDLSSNGTYVNGVHKLERLINTQVIPGTVLELGDGNCTVALR